LRDIYAFLLPRTIEQNAHTMNRGISTGSKNGNAIAASISPTKASAPTTISPTPAKTKAKSIATQNRITSASINPHAPIMASKGLVIGCPFTVIVTARPLANNAQARIAIINTAKINASFFINTTFLLGLHVLCDSIIFSEFYVQVNFHSIRWIFFSLHMSFRILGQTVALTSPMCAFFKSSIKVRDWPMPPPILSGIWSFKMAWW